MAASECIARLDLADLSPDLFGLSPLAIQKRHDDAFNVEPVTEEFFKTFVRLFYITCLQTRSRKRLTGIRKQGHLRNCCSIGCYSCTLFKKGLAKPRARLPLQTVQAMLAH